MCDQFVIVHEKEWKWILIKKLLCPQQPLRKVKIANWKEIPEMKKENNHKIYI
jgi:hypothetical protein